MPSVLRLKPEEVDTPEKRGVFQVTLVGCGRAAVFYAIAFAGAGFKVKCADANQSVVKQLSKGNIRLDDRQAESTLKSLLRKELVSATNDVKTAVSGSDIVVVTANAKIDAKKTSDYSEIESICRQVGAGLQKGSLVVCTGVVGLGYIETVVKEAIENTSGLKAGEDFGLAFQPSFVSAKTQAGQLSNGELTVAADDKYSLNTAASIFQTITKQAVRRISNVRLAELAVLFAGVKRDAIEALANELAVFCESAGLDYSETAKLFESDSCEASSFPTISEEGNRDEAYLLLENAENLNVKLRIPSLARQVNEDMVRHAVNLAHEVLRDSGKTVRRAQIALLGNVEAGTAAATFVDLLRSKGARISRYDPSGSETEQTSSEYALKKTLNETVEGADCVVVLSAQEQLKRLNLKKLHAIMKAPGALLDLVGAVEPEKAEKEGFVYRGLGRGAWKK